MDNLNEPEDLSTEEKEWVVSDMIRKILRDADHVEHEDHSLEPRKWNRLESARSRSRPVTEGRTVIFETLCVPIFKESDDVMAPCGIMSPSAGNFSFDLNDIGRIVSIPAGRIKQLLYDDIDNITLWPSGDNMNTIYALLKVERQLLLDSDVNI